MPKDYVSRSKKVAKKRWYLPGGRYFSWIVLGIMIVILPLFIFTFSMARRYYLKGGAPGAPVVSVSPAENVKVADKKDHPSDTLLPQKEEPEDIHFEFYKILPKTVVETSPSSTSRLRVSHQRYIVQIASLSDEEEAKDFQAILRKKGFNVRIVSIRRGEVMLYRIQAGPFSNRRKAQRTHDRLQDENINSIIVAR